MSEIGENNVEIREPQIDMAVATATPAEEAPTTGAPEAIPEAVAQAMAQAQAAEAQGVDKGIEAWRKLIAANPELKTLRTELARVYRGAERWNALAEQLKEQVEKLAIFSKKEKVAALLELIGIYRDRLKLEAMVVNTYNILLGIEPENQQALTELCAQYERMKRWPDLISALQKKAALVAQVDDGKEAVALYTRVAELFQEKFSNAAEAIKAYEKVIELDVANSAAVAFLKINYEKRRDWEKLISVHLKEISSLASSEEKGARLVEVAKLASEKLKKPAVSIDLWAKVLEAIPGHAEALAELEKLYEREKLWDKLADVCRQQVASATDSVKKLALLQKLGILFSDKVNDPARAVEVWRSLLELEPENRRAQDALKKLYLTQKDWAALEAFYAAQGKYDEYVRILERQTETEDDATKVVLNLRIAELYRDRLQKPDRAMRAYEKVLTIDANNLGAAEALLPLYEAAKDARKLCAVLEIQLAHTQEAALRKERMQRLAELCTAQLKDQAAALRWCLKAFAEERAANEPLTNDWPMSDIERLVQETGAWAELISAYEAAYDTFASPHEALPLMATVAKVYEKELGDGPKALATNQRILALDENHADALAALERGYIATQQFGELLGIYEKRLALETDQTRQKEIRYKLASLFEDEVKDLGRAAEAYHAIVTDYGDELEALRALDRIFTATARWQEVAAIIPRELGLVSIGDNQTVIDLKYRLGAIVDDHLGDVAGAIACFRDILDIDPEHAGACERLERRLTDEAHQLEAAAILEPIYHRLSDWDRLIEVKEIQLAREADRTKRVELLLQIGELEAEKKVNGEKAFAAYSRCFREDPSVEVARAELERLAAAQEKWAELVTLYETALSPDAPQPIDPQLQHELFSRVAETYAERLEQADKAIIAYGRALALESDDLTSLAALEKLYAKSEKWPELLEIYRKRVDLTNDPAARETLFFQIACLWEEALHNVDEAIAAYREVLAQDEGNAKALRALDRLYQGKQAWPELSDIVQRQLSLTDERGETVALLGRLAALREGKLGEVEAAIDTYSQVLGLDPGNEAAMTALERLLKLPEHELAVATILEPVYKASDDWVKLVAAYEILARHALDPARKIELLHQIAELYDVGGDDAARAFQTYDRALRADPGFKETQTRIERLARTLKRWPELIALYQDIAQNITDEQLRVQLWTRVAQIQEVELGSSDAAATAYLKVLESDPYNLAAADALEAIYLKAENYAKLVEVVLRKVEMVSDVEEKKALASKAAQIYQEVLDDPEHAIQVFQMILGFDENDIATIDSLERLYTRLERWPSLKDIYRKKAELTSSVEEKKQIYFVLAQVYDRQLKDVQSAIETYQIILDLDPEDLQAIRSLDRLHGAAERWYDLLQILEREVELAATTNEMAELKHRIGLLWQHQLKDMARAVESYREVLTVHAGHEPTLRALESIVQGDTEPVSAAEVLLPILETTGDWENLSSTLEVMVRHADNPSRRVELLQRVAELSEQRLHDAAKAFDAFARAFREDSQAENTVFNLERLARDSNAWKQLADLYDEELKKVMEPIGQVELLLRAARVYEEELSDVERAIATYRRVLEVDPEQKIAILSLDRLYHTRENWSDLAEILRREIHLAEGDAEAVALQFRLGQLLEIQLKELDGAIEVYREILSADATHAPTLSALELLFADEVKPLEIATILEPLYRAGEQWEKLVRIYEVQLRRIEDPADRVAMLQRIAEICEQRLMNEPAALAYWSRALAEAPMSELAGEEVERLAATTGAWGELEKLYLQIITDKTDAEIQRRILLKLARVYVTELHNGTKAEESYLQVLALDPKDADALAALDHLYESSGIYNELADILGRRIGATNVTDEIIELYFRLGHIYAQALQAPDHAIASYNAILEIDSRNAKALESLEQIYFQREQWAELYNIYEKLLDIAPTDQQMAECYARMAKLSSDALHNHAGAIDLWGRVIDLRGEDAIALAHLRTLHEQSNSWRELVDIIGRQLHLHRDPQDQVRLWDDLGHIYLEKLGQERDALDAWQHALAIDQSNIEVLRALGAIYRQLESWEDLVETLHRLIEVGTMGGLDSRELLELYAQLGELQGTTLMRSQPAIEAWLRVLQLDPTSLRALNALEQLYTQEARWDGSIEILERKASVLEDTAQKIDALLRAAAIWNEKLEEQNRAAALYERIIAIDPSNLEASLRIEEIYRTLGKWERLVELFLQRTEIVSDGPTRVQLYQEVANIYERQLHDHEGAFVVLQAAFKQDYANDATAHELERLATATNKWSELLTDYTQVVQTIEDPQMAASLWVKIGRWYGEHLGHLDYAIASANQALTLDANQPEALATLADAYRKTNKWPELADVLTRHAALPNEEPAKRVDLYLVLADLYESTLAEPQKAIDAYRAACEIDPACLDAYNALERIYRQAECWPELVEALTHKAQLIEGDESLALRQQIGLLYQERLGDTTKAIATFKDILTFDDHNLAALRALEHLYEKTAAIEPYLDVLEQQLDIVPSDNERITVYERIALAWEKHFRQLGRACDALEKILLIDEHNEPTLVSLERLYAEEKRWEDLVHTYRRHISLTSDAAQRCKFCAAIGAVYENELKDNDRAIEAYNEILAIDQANEAALDALSRLYEKIEEWNRAVDILTVLGQLATEPARRCELLQRMGRVLDEHLRDSAGGEARYLEALSLDSGYLPALISLNQLYQRRGDWMKAAQTMVRAEAFTPRPLEKVQLLFDAGHIYLTKLDDKQRASELFARVLELDPEHMEAGEPLAEFYFNEAMGGADRWLVLEPILDMLIRKADKKEHAELVNLYYRLAKTSDQLGNSEKALKFYKLALDLNPAHPAALLGRAALLYKLEDWDGAFKLYQTILVNQSLRDSQKDTEIVDIFNRLGNIKLKLGERKKALNMFEKALELDPVHRPTLTAIIDLQTGQGDFEAVVQAKRAMAQTADDAESCRIFEEIGDIYHEKLKNPEKAIEGYLQALARKADHHVVLQKLLELYHETAQWKKMVETMERFTQVEQNPLIRGKYLEAAAKVLRDELKSPDEAIEFFNRALDSYFEKAEGITPSNFQNYLKAFEAIDRICTSKKDWKTQVRNYRRMLKRFPPTGHEQVKIALWHGLGEIYRTRLRDFPTAMLAFETAVALDPTHIQRREILAELYILAGPENYEKAAKEHATLIRHNPLRFESYKALARLYKELRQPDKRWCMCGALVYAGRADAEEQAFYEQNKPKALLWPRQRISDELWAGILHPDEDQYIGAVFAAIWQAIALLKSGEHKQFGLKRKEKLDVATHQALFTRVFARVADTLRVPMPEIYLRPDQQIDLRLANCKEKGMLIPSLVVGSEMLQGRSDKELAYHTARFLTKLRPEHYLKDTLPTNTELRIAFLSAIKLVQPGFPVKPNEAAVVDQYVQVMRTTIQPGILEQLGMVVQRFLGARSDIDLAKWAQAVELSAHRAGLIFCGDLALAARYVQLEPVGVGGMPSKEKAKELMLYAVSEPYFQLRQQLGINIQA